MSRFKEGWLKTNGISMHYVDWGGPGPSVIALHGAASSCHWYNLTIPHLTERFRVFALDQRGHGKTDQPDTGYDWNTLATDVAGALDQLQLQRVGVMGHSWGASVALHVAARYPARVSHLVLIDGGFSLGRTQGDTWESFRERLSPRDIYGPKERYLGALRQQLARSWSDELERMVMTMVRIDADGSVHERLELSNQQQMLWAMWSEPSSEAFPLILCPTLIVAASPTETPENRDRMQRRREAAAAAQQAIGRCQLVWIPDTIHDIGYDKPEELARVISDFLSQA